MFSSIHSSRNSKDETHAIIDCYDVRYSVYFTSDGLQSEVVSYVVHLGRNAIIRRDTCPLCPLFNWGGPYTVLYPGAK